MKYKPNYKLIIGLVLIVIAFGAITVLVLSKFIPQDKATVINLGPAEIVKQYKTTGAVSGLSDRYDKMDQALTGMSVIAYTSDDSYTIYGTPTDFVQFEQKDKATANSTSIKSAVETFLITNSFKKKLTNPNKESTLATIFENNQTVCQLVDLPPFKETNAVLSLSCIKKSTLDDKYSEINKLLALYGDRKPSIGIPDNISINTIKDDNKILSIINIYGIGSKKSAVALVFAAISGKWEYLGQRVLSSSTPGVDNGLVNGAMSDDLKTSIKDTKYGEFLKRRIHIIQGY
ncbi:hypothetical protein H7X69_03020 [Candidatus Saccharibacteria bacterium]|nr:hypothetical protein [Candidatus Saccharibacteria bacterium]